MRQSYELSIICRWLSHHRTVANILRLKVLKDILDAGLYFGFIPCCLSKVALRVMIGYNLRCSKVIE